MKEKYLRDGITSIGAEMMLREASCKRAIKALKDYHDPRQRELYLARQRGIADGSRVEAEMKKKPVEMKFERELIGGSVPPDVDVEIARRMVGMVQAAGKKLMDEITLIEMFNRKEPTEYRRGGHS